MNKIQETAFRYSRRVSQQNLLTMLLLAASVSQSAHSQERWFQVEVSIFTNENLSDRSEEQWIPGTEPLAYPDSLRRLNELRDILSIDSLLPQEDSNTENSTENSTDLSLTPQQQQAAELAAERARLIANTGPMPATSGSGFRFFDLQRDSFIQLPDSQSDFQQTNRALRQSPEHRLLFHGLWRQAVQDPGLATPIYISGGDSFGEYQELMGSLAIEFNEGRTRVVINTDLWLAEFTTRPTQQSADAALPQWTIPLPPQALREESDSELDNPYYPARVYHMQQSREMRSTEFHYLDHPALGIVVMVEPYEVPDLPPPGFSSMEELPLEVPVEDDSQ